MNQEDLLAQLTSDDRFRSSGKVYLKVTTQEEILWLRAIDVFHVPPTSPPWDDNALVIEGFETVARLPRRTPSETYDKQRDERFSVPEAGEITVHRRSPEDRQRYVDEHFPSLKDKLVAAGIPADEIDNLREIMLNTPVPSVLLGVDPGENTTGVAEVVVDPFLGPVPLPYKQVPFPHEAIQKAILDLSLENWAKFWEESNETDLKANAAQHLITHSPGPEHDLPDIGSPMFEPEEKLDTRWQTPPVELDEVPEGIRPLESLPDEEVERFRREWALQNTTKGPTVIRPGAWRPLIILDPQTDGPADDNSLPWEPTPCLEEGEGNV